ncbi:MAG: signal recognition particle protein [Planctomycetota bacterium]
MFESISKRLSGVFAGLTGRKLTEDNIQEGLREVRKALLEADVSFRVVKEFISAVSEKAVGQEVIRSVSPAQMFIKIVHDEMVRLMGPGDTSIPWAEKGPTVIMLAGLQGSGKTTTCGKLASYLRKRHGKNPILVAADIQRPAAVTQLKVLGSQLDVPVYSDMSKKPPVICRDAVEFAKRNGHDVVILDTAGRLHIDEPLMSELEEVSKLASPHQIYLVCDAMTGQDAVTSAKEFNDRLELDGVILTKMDGDARGGAALSIRYITGKPIKFMGVGEKSDALEEFHPDRIASRVLGMGDVVSLVEKAQEVITQEEALKMQEKLLKSSMTLEDFLDQLRRLKKLGDMKDILGLIPGLGSKLDDLDFDDKEFRRIEAIILSMTPDERRHPEILNNSRKLRIAKGSGTDMKLLNGFLKQFSEMRKMMAKFSKPQGLFGKLSNLMPGRKSLPKELDELENMQGAPGIPMPGLGVPQIPGKMPGAGGPKKKLSQKEKKALRNKHKKKRHR